MQMKAQLEQQKQQSDKEHQMMKLQAEASLEQQKFEHAKQLDLLEHGMKVEEHKHKLVHMAVDAATKPVPEGQSKPPVDQEFLKTLVASMGAGSRPNKGMKIVRDAHGRVSHAVPVE